mgnify:CR=1 FL=1
MDMRSAKYPYRLDVERRLPNGSLTTDGYAARHPVEFRHWGHARGYVLWVSGLTARTGRTGVSTTMGNND